MDAIPTPPDEARLREIVHEEVASFLNGLAGGGLAGLVQQLVDTHLKSKRPPVAGIGEWVTDLARAVGAEDLADFAPQKLVTLDVTPERWMEGVTSSREHLRRMRCVLDACHELQTFHGLQLELCRALVIVGVHPDETADEVESRRREIVALVGERLASSEL